MTNSTPTPVLAQLTDHWRGQLRPRLTGLTDDEYFWEPVPGSLNVRPRGSGVTPMAAGSGEFEIDWVWPEPVPAPITTIAWRLGHVIVGVLAMRNAAHFGGPATDYMTWEYAGSAAGALTQLDHQVERWVHGVSGLTDEALSAACGESEGPYADRSMLDLVLHISREVIHHGAEIALLRDLYAHR